MIIFVHIDVFSNKKTEIEKTCSMYEAHETCICNFMWNILRDGTSWEPRHIQKCNWNRTQTNGVLKYEVDTAGPELGSSGSECENEL